MKTREPIEWCARKDCTHDDEHCLNFYCNDAIAVRSERQNRGYGKEWIYKEIRCLPHDSLFRYGYYKDIYEGGQCKHCYERRPMKKCMMDDLERLDFKINDVVNEMI